MMYYIFASRWLSWVMAFTASLSWGLLSAIPCQPVRDTSFMQPGARKPAWD